jgi:hypothetical protein
VHDLPRHHHLAAQHDDKLMHALRRQSEVG